MGQQMDSVKLTQKGKLWKLTVSQGFHDRARTKTENLPVLWIHTEVASREFSLQEEFWFQVVWLLIMDWEQAVFDDVIDFSTEVLWVCLAASPHVLINFSDVLNLVLA